MCTIKNLRLTLISKDVCCSRISALVFRTYFKEQFLDLLCLDQQSKQKRPRDIYKASQKLDL